MVDGRPRCLSEGIAPTVPVGVDRKEVRVVLIFRHRRDVDRGSKDRFIHLVLIGG
jgi:hypothetical protein